MYILLSIIGTYNCIIKIYSKNICPKLLTVSRPCLLTIKSQTQERAHFSYYTPINVAEKIIFGTSLSFSNEH